MIRYALRCDRGHQFESWFASADAFDTLARSGHLSCPECGSCAVEKAVMAPRVAQGSRAADKPARRPATQTALSDADRMAENVARLRRAVEAQSDDVGRNFAAEARAIHEGDAPDRAIRGEATAPEARKLIEDGVPILPLPFPPRRKMS